MSFAKKKVSAIRLDTAYVNIRCTLDGPGLCIEL